jgi:hypothetical protein
VSAVHEQLPDGIEYDVVRESCRPLVGVRIDDQLATDFAHRIAGNLPRLRRHRPVTPWVMQRIFEWVPLQIAGVCRRWRRRQIGGDFAFFVLAGTPAGMTIRRWWSTKYCHFIARDLGFSRPAYSERAQPKYPFTALEQFVSLRFYARLDPELGRSDGPSFRKIKFHASTGEWNREQLRCRFRVDEGYDCPEDYVAEFPCHCCAKGYLSCRAGTHARDYLFRKCDACGDLMAPFDPERPEDDCVNCTRRAVSRRPEDD